MTTVEKQNTIQEELLNQKELRKCENSFQEKEIINKKIIVGKYISDNKFKYNDTIYNLNSYEDILPDEKGVKVYIPIFVIKFNELEFKFSPGWFKSEKSARNKLNNYDSIIGNLDDEILTVVNNKTYSKYLTNLIGKDVRSLVVNFIGLQYIISVGSIGFISAYLGYIKANHAYLLSEPILGIPVLFLIISFIFILQIIELFIGYYLITETENSYEKFYPINNIDLTKSNLNGEYKIVQADVNINNTELILNSEELDCRWTFEKNNMNRLSDEVVKFLRESIENDSIVISVNKEWSQNSMFQSDDNEWWIESI